MKSWTRFMVALGGPALLWAGAAAAQGTGRPAAPSQTPQTVAGRIVKIDRDQGRVTVRATDGTTHEFQASRETLQNLREGDPIEARLRQP